MLYLVARDIFGHNSDEIGDLKFRVYLALECGPNQFLLLKGQRKESALVRSRHFLDIFNTYSKDLFGKLNLIKLGRDAVQKQNGKNSDIVTKGGGAHRMPF